MLVFKVIFWLLCAVSFTALMHCCQDHPRERSDVNLGTDMIDFIINMALVVWVFNNIW